MNKRILIFALILAAFVIYTRSKFHAHYLYSWDSVSFALSIEHFDVHLHQPHPPGYILYSYTIRALNPLFKDANHTMIALNIAATIGACLLLYKVVMLASGNEVAAIGASALYAVNPVASFYGSIAEIYAVEGFWVVAIVYLLLLSRKKNTNLIWAAAAMAVAGGFRPTTEVFMLPVFLACCLIRNRKVILLALTVLVIGNLLWFVPLVVKSDGFESYMDAVRGQSERAAESASETGEEGSVIKLFLGILQAITIPVFLAILFRIQRVRFQNADWIFALAILPSLIFFIFFPFPKEGYLLVFIPLLIGIGAAVLNRIYSMRAMILIFIVACVATWFFFAKPLESSTVLDDFTEPNVEMIRAKMDRVRDFIQTVDGLQGDGHRIFVLDSRHFFPNWRTIVYYYPNDPIYLVLPNKKRAYFAKAHEYKIVPAPMEIPLDSVLIAVGRTKPELKMDMFQVGSFRYYFSSVRSLPGEFKLYSMECEVK